MHFPCRLQLLSHKNPTIPPYIIRFFAPLAVAIPRKLDHPAVLHGFSVPFAVAVPQKRDHPAVHHTFFAPLPVAISQKVAYTPGQRRIDCVRHEEPRDHSFRSGRTYGPIRQDCLYS